MRQLRVGVALGSGGAKGFAHIGVLAALLDHHIPIDVIAGSSMGSLVGGAFAMGVTPRVMQAVATQLKPRHWLDFKVPKMGFLQGDKVHEVVGLLTRNANIEDTNIPLAIVATDLVARELVVFRQGNIADAVRASISIPGVFKPVVRDGAVYVDGGVLERVPVQATYDLGADIVISVDVGLTPRGTVPSSTMDVIMQSLELMQDQVFRYRIQPLQAFNIYPAVSHIGTSQFGRADEAITIGYEATKARISEIEDAISTRLSRDVQTQVDGCAPTEKETPSWK